ncbi:DUF4861 domain-containing protein [Sphingobacterium sp. LRF_L2]|uniref:DUF4861 domain-containing protein n=1 Tax=Sphingobacterium sp. LRF_L2 TaxID=3369421 RepID=UPI003F5E36EA
MHYLKKGILCVCTTALLAACGNSASPSFELQLENKSDIVLKDYPIKIEAAKLKFPKSEKFFPIVISEKGDTLAAQLDDINGDGKWDELFFVVNLDANQQQKYTLHWSSDSIAFPFRTRVRHGVRTSLADTVRRSNTGVFLPHQLPLVAGFQPFQTDGPSWENDKVGFRHYLDGRNSKDVFGKRVADLAPRNVGINKDGVTEDNYHVMESWGRDILAVGNSLGVGGISLVIGDDSLYRMGSIEGDTLGPIDKTTFNVYAEGPVRSIVDFAYEKWKLPNGRRYDANERVEIWPGMYGYKNTVEYRGLQGDEQLLVGLVNSRTDKPLKEFYANDQWVILSTHDMQTYEKEWYLGLALVLPRSVYKGYIEAPAKGRIATSYLAKLSLQDNQPLSYYALACWELRDPQFRSEKYFEEYLREFVGQISANVTISIHEK